MAKSVPFFKDPTDRHNWIVENAEYFTVVRLKNRKYERYETSNLPKAKNIANVLVAREPHSRWMIYACAGISDTLVEVVSNDRKYA